VGVHNVEVYPEVKRLLGIPEDEPIFIIRAQDKLSLPTVMYYADEAFDACTDEFNEGMNQVEASFRGWQDENKNKVRVPN
jgi:hypothetical protein